MKKGDIVVIIIIIMLALILIIVPYRKPNDNLLVRINSDEYDIHTDRVIELETLTIHIESSEVFVTHANCPDKVCMQMGKIKNHGDFIACIPSGVVITIVNGSNSYDKIAG